MPEFSGFDVLVFTYSDWHANWSTPQQIAARLAPANRVLFVDQPRSFLFGLRPSDPLGAGSWTGPRLQEVQPNLFVYHLPHVFLPTGNLPFPWGRRTLTLNGQAIAWLVKRQMEKIGMTRPVLWNFSPLHGAAVSRIPASLTIYDICDEWGSYLPEGGGRELLAWIEAQLTRAADLIFVGTDNMLERRRGLNRELHVVHHAADYAHFARATAPETAVPKDLAALPHPVVGYVGVMDRARFDVDLIYALAQANPGWSIPLIGPARRDVELSRLKTCTNVYLLGNRRVEDLPAYLKGLDVSLIPYRMNEATANIYPLKLQEYLAAEKPVVAVPLPALLSYGDVVYLADGAADFSEAIRRALAEDSPARRAARGSVAVANSWEHRIAEKTGHVLRLIAEHPKTQGATAR